MGWDIHFSELRRGGRGVGFWHHRGVDPVFARDAVELAIDAIFGVPHRQQAAAGQREAIDVAIDTRAQIVAGNWTPPLIAVEVKSIVFPEGEGKILVESLQFYEFGFGSAKEEPEPAVFPDAYDWVSIASPWT